MSSHTLALSRQTSAGVRAGNRHEKILQFGDGGEQVREAAPGSGNLLEGRTLRVAAEEWVPHIAVREDRGGNISISGPMANLLHALSSALGFSYTLVRPPDGAWGIPTEAGDWNGMIGMVKRNEADLALGPFGLTYSRSRVVDFSSPILIDYYRILTKRPRSEPNPKGFLTPFRLVLQEERKMFELHYFLTAEEVVYIVKFLKYVGKIKWHVWIGLVLSVGVIGAVLFGVRKAAHTFFGGEEMHASKNAIFGLVCSYSHMYGLSRGVSLTGKTHELWCVPAYTWLSRSWSGRVVVGMWSLAALIVARSYSSALTSMLAVRTVPVKYNYLRQVIGDPDIHLIFEKATALVEHMSTVQEGVYKDLANTIQQDRAHFLASSKLYDAAYTDVRNRQFALLVEDTTCRKVFSDDFTKYGRCDFYIGKERYWPLVFCLIGRKGMPIMQAINSRIERLVSHDLYFKWLEDELPNATACLKASTKITVNEAYDLTGLWGVFVLFLGGLVVASLVLMTEVCVAVVADWM
ncbi:glutamate receptor ionotropic, kainate glr-3-like [Penaeus vannamei]|uniref:glutamate receptor ionotropic, kainate glr-3-like n=1 Tax=Penaeus vannamei TaxID=6689 RepID=UPI00387F7C63